MWISINGHSETFKTTKEEILELYNEEKQKLGSITLRTMHGYFPDLFKSNLKERRSKSLSQLQGSSKVILDLATQAKKIL